MTEKIFQAKYKYIFGLVFIVLAFGLFITIEWRGIPKGAETSTNQITGAIIGFIGFILRDIFKTEPPK